MTPIRIQRKRTKGWRMPEGAIYVGRPSRWRNPYRIVPQHSYGPFDILRGHEFIGQSTGMYGAREMVIRRFKEAVERGCEDVAWPVEIRRELRGKDLACWCPLDQPCHADVLLELANREVQ